MKEISSSLEDLDNLEVTVVTRLTTNTNTVADPQQYTNSGTTKNKLNLGDSIQHLILNLE